MIIMAQPSKMKLQLSIVRKKSKKIQKVDILTFRFSIIASGLFYTKAVLFLCLCNILIPAKAFFILLKKSSFRSSEKCSKINERGKRENPINAIVGGWNSEEMQMNMLSPF